MTTVSAIGSGNKAPLTAAAVLAQARSLQSEGDVVGARALVRSLIDEAPTGANIAAAARTWEMWEASPLPGEATVRLAVMGTGTLEPLGAHLRVAAAGIGLHPQVYVGGFNQWAQEMLEPSGPLHAFAPEIITLVIDGESLFPRTLNDPFLTPEDAETEAAAGVATLRRVLKAVSRNAPETMIVLHTFATPDYAPLGMLDAQQNEHSQRSRLTRINEKVAALVRDEAFSRVFLFDQERIEARFGKARVRDARRWYLASMPFSDDFLRVLALEYRRILRPLKGLTRKCIVLDLDNTLWGGVIGEDGMAGIKLGGSAAPGNAFRDFQAALDSLRKRGVLLAVCSKNNPDDALPVMEQHPDMLLRPSALAALRVNWDDKATNIAAIARELNIGLDSLVFLDDNPAERALIRERLPQVLTPDLPRDPAQYVAALMALDVFDAIALTDEDRRRAEQYAEQRKRREFEAQLTGANADGEAPFGEGTADYLTELGIEVALAPATPFTLPRIAQLINKTNQFNLTTRRYTEGQVQAMVDDATQWGVYSAHVRDRFGDSGLTGVAIARKQGDTWEIDSFLLSCRVLSRGVEQALLRFVGETARAEGATTLLGRFLPTAKNTPAADFYARMGFTRAAEADGDGETWTARIAPGAELPEAIADYPHWLSIKTEEN